MENQFERIELLLGAENLDILKGATVAVFGVGGVGGYVVEALARSGVGHLVLIDNDKVALSNINRQIIATHSTVGRSKVQVMKERVLDINPMAQVDAIECFYLPETADRFDFSQYDYVVDAVDTVTAKIDIILKAQEAGCGIMSSMGAGNKLDPTQFKVADIYKTDVCPLAKVMRRELKKRGVKKLKVVYSTERAIFVPAIAKEEAAPAAESDAAGKESTTMMGSKRRSTPGSCAFVPSVAGLIIAGEVIKDLLLEKDLKK